MTRRERRLLWALLAGGVAVRLVWAFTTRGLEYDIRSVEIVADQLGRAPGQLYVDLEGQSRWPYPSGYLPLVWLANRAAIATGIPLSSWIHLPPIVADAVLGLIVHRGLGIWGASARQRLAGAALVLVGPVFLVNAGYHGQFDSVAILPAVLALLAWEQRPTERRALTAGLLIGVGVVLKTIPGLMLLALLPTARSRREALTLVAAAVAVPAVLLVPWAIVDVGAMIDAMRYAGSHGAGGLTLVLQPDSAARWLTKPVVEPNLAVRLVTEDRILFNALVLAATGALLAWRRVPAPEAAVIVWLAVWTFGTGIFFGYFIWGLPFLVLALRLRVAASIQALLVVPTALFYLGPWQDGAVVAPYAVAMIAVWTVGLVALAAAVSAALGRPQPRWPQRAAALGAAVGARVRALQITRGEAVCGAALTVWALAPLANLVRHAWKTGERFTGADGFFAGDQHQYLWWVRDAAHNGLMSNGFDLAQPSHVFAHPMFDASALLWRLGVDIGTSYLVWKPVALCVLLVGFGLYVRRTVAGEWARTGAFALAVFFAPPVAFATSWLGLGGAQFEGDVLEVLGRMFPGAVVLGYLPAAIALGLMPLFLLALERTLEPRDGDGRSPRWYAAWAAVAGGLASWLHPWQGVVLLLVTFGVVAWGRFDRRYLRLWLPVAATALPIVYYFALSRLDAAWEIGQDQNSGTHLGLAALVAALGPLLALAAFGIRRPAGVCDRMLLLWPVAAFVAYAATPSVPAHALGGLSLPLAVLAVRGWQGRTGVASATAAVALLCLPGMAVFAREYRDIQRARVQPHWLTRDDARALRWLERHGAPGGVLARPTIASAVPSETGRRVWVGHPSWTRDYAQRAASAEDLFTGRVRGAPARHLVQHSGARFLVSSCASDAADLRRTVGRDLLRVRRFGCAVVYELVTSAAAPRRAAHGSTRIHD